MAVFSVNQNKQFYVIKNVASAETNLVNAGDFILKQSKKDKSIIFKHVGMGGLTRSDIIDPATITYARETKSAEMQRKLKKATVTLNAIAMAETNPISGEDYVIRIEIPNYLSPSDASILVKAAAVRSTKDMTAGAFYKKLADQLNKSFARETEQYLKFTGSASGLVIEAKRMPYRQGLVSEDIIDFKVYPSTITVDGSEEVWGKVVYSDGEAVENGRQIADLEYFCMGERGDVLRNMGWPYNIDVKYMVNPEEKYDVIDLHYSYSGDGVQNHKSEKEITLVIPTTATGILTKVETALTDAGITLEKKG